MSRWFPILIPCLAAASLFALQASGFRSIPTEPTVGDAMLDEYFERETRRIAARSEAFLKNVEDWDRSKDELRRQLFEMLGLQPLPARSDLRARVTSTVEREGVVVENLVFQSRPGLYVTASFYRPAEQDGPLPTILYLCGHGRVAIDGVSYGNKAHYQHHGTWFAKNGYTCLIIDTLQLGEIEGIHHGTHRFDRWWWNSRGYTPAGVEAWNAIRAIDYLETREEVDPGRIGATGRSGGGAYTFWVAALDERVKAAAPVAGITNMRNHIVDGCIEGHCDCMFMVNTYRWDFPLLAALVAPRPLLILNTDKDRIFPLDGVVDVYQKTSVIYEKLGVKEHLGLALYEGGHLDTQPIRVPAFHWFERHLKGAEVSAELEHTTAPKIFEPTELKALDEIPGNERNSFIDEYFTRSVADTLSPAESEADWQAQQGLVLNRLRTRTFRGWPAISDPPVPAPESEQERDGVRLSRWSFESQPGISLPLYVVHGADQAPGELDLVVLNALDDEGWQSFLSTLGAAFPEAFGDAELPALDEEAFAAEVAMHAAQPWAMAYLPPRGIGPTAWTPDERERVHIRRRFALIGQTLDGMRIWDLRRGLQALRELEGFGETRLWLQAGGEMAANALYTALHESGVERLDLHDPPSSHLRGCELLNVLRFTDLPEIAAMVGDRSQLRFYTAGADTEGWSYLVTHAERFGWDEGQLQWRELPTSDGEEEPGPEERTLGVQ